MLPFWRILEWIRTNGISNPTPEQRETLCAALAAHDLAVKVLEVEGSRSFNKLVPHLQALSDGAVHLTHEPPAYADTYNKLIELYWACLLISQGVDLQLDHPTNADGTNPDIITLDKSQAAEHGYAFKTIRSPHTQSLLDHLVKGVDQIEVSNAPTGIVALHLTPRLRWRKLWPEDFVFIDWRFAASHVITLMRGMLGQLIAENGQAAIDNVFTSKKAVGPGTLHCVRSDSCHQPHHGQTDVHAFESRGRN